MAESQNLKALLQLFLNDYLVDYLIVGAYAVIRYAEPHSTKDLFRAADGIQMGVPPVSVEILTSISGCVFEDAWTDTQPEITPAST